MFECYDKIIGLSNHNCVCTQENRPEDYNQSASGLFLDELAPIGSLVTVAECDKTMWDILEQARETAIKKFVSDTNALLKASFVMRRAQAKDQFIGQRVAKETYTGGELGSRVVARIQCAPIRGGVMRLNKVGIAAGGSGALGVQVLDNLGTQHFLGAVGALTGTYTTIEVDKELPMHSKYVPALEYYVLVTIPPTVELYKTEVDCGCGGLTPKFNNDNPGYNYLGSHPRAPWSDYIMVGGSSSDSFSATALPQEAVTNKMYGIALEVDFVCKVHEVLCSGTLDFEGNPLALSLAFAIRYQAAVQVGEAVLKSTKLSRETMLGAEQWEDSIAIWQDKYNQHVNHIVQNVDHSANDCLTCKDILKMTREGVFS